MRRTASHLLPLAILGLAFALRTFRLGVDSLWYDETVSVWLARQDLAEITRHTAGDIHPPLYYYLLHFWGGAAGWSEYAVASFSLVWGVLLVALIYRAGRAWFGHAAATLAALVTAFSPYNVWYSQEVRMYTLGALLGLGATYAAWRALDKVESAECRVPSGQKQASWGAGVLFVVLSAAGLYTLYYFAFLLVFLNLAVLVWSARRWAAVGRAPWPEVRRWAGMQLGVALLYVPWIPVAFRQATDPPVPPWRELTPLPQLVVESFTALSFGQSVEPERVWPLLVVTALVLAAALWPRRFLGSAALTVRQVWARVGGFGYAFVPLGVIALLSLWRPLYHVRYVFTYSPGFYLLVGAGLARLLGEWCGDPTPHPPSLPGKGASFPFPWQGKGWGLGSWMRLRGSLAVVGGLALVGGSALSLQGFWFDTRYAADDLRGAVQHLAEKWRPGDVVLVNAGYAYTSLVYFPFLLETRMRLPDYTPAEGEGPVVLQTGSIGGAGSLGWGDPRSDFYATTAAETEAALERVKAAHPRLWVLRVYDTVVDPDGVVRSWLARRAVLIDDTVYSGQANARVQGYLLQTPERVPPGARVINARLGDRMRLAAVEIRRDAVRPGDPFDLALYWRPEQTLNLNYHVSVQVTGPDDHKWGQFDEMPLGNALATTRWQEGEVYREPVRVWLDPAAPPGEYAVRVVLYNPLSGETVGEAVQAATLRVFRETGP